MTNPKPVPDVINGLPIAIIGAGPAGLMAAEVLSKAGHLVHVYEQKPSAARKFLMAGKTGLNISHAEPVPQFLARYDQADWLAPMIEAFDATAIRQWMTELGIESYVGSSGRIFPVEMKAAPLLRAWITRLKAQGVQFFYRHQWLGWDAQDHLLFSILENTHAIAAKAVILAMGGGSWARLGSDGAWFDILKQHHIDLLPLQPSNVGVQVKWSPFIVPHAGQPLKRVQAWVNPEHRYMGEAVLTHYGLEGGLIYKLSRELRQSMNEGETACFYLDLLPDVTLDQLQHKLKPQAGQSLNNLWRKAGLDGLKAHLIREILPKVQWHDALQVALIAKNLPITVQGFQPIDEAISTAGGVTRNALDENLMLQQKAGVFCAGEMLDWDAPTGGYLLTACFATGQAAAQGVLNWLA